jgi:uncharacterized protein
MDPMMLPSTVRPPRKPLLLPRQMPTVAAIDLDLLQANGVAGLILDLDNTIVSEDDRYLSPHAEAWIAAAQRAGLRCFILSNGKRRHRVDYWSQRLQVPALSPARKPFPRAFRRALRHLALPPEQVVVVGDSRHTDVLGAWLAGCTSIQVASLPHPPRWWERWLGTWVQQPYPADGELWSLEGDR